MAPGVFGKRVAVEIRAAPVLRVARLLHEIHEAILAFGKISVVHFKAVERILERADLRDGRRDFRAAYAEAAGFEPAVAAFFKDVLVMADDRRLRDARLALLKRLERLILQLGDISELVASET